MMDIKVFSASHFAAEEKSRGGGGADGGQGWRCWNLDTAATEHKQRVKARIQD